jgi:hypothetical protein
MPLCAQPIFGLITGASGSSPTLLLLTHVTVFTTRRVFGKSEERVYNVNVGFRRVALVV